MKQRVDLHRHDMKFYVGDYFFFLKLAHCRQNSLASRVNENLALYFISLFKEIHKVATMVYKLQFS